MRYLHCSELMPTADQNQKSFYGKARVETYIKNGKDVFILKSYSTDVLVIYKDKLYRSSDTYEGTFSRTTLKHCRAFVEQYIISNVRSKKEFMALDEICIATLL